MGLARYGKALSFLVLNGAREISLDAVGFGMVSCDLVALGSRTLR